MTLKHGGWIGLVALVCGAAVAQAETLKIQGPDGIYDCYMSDDAKVDGLNRIGFREYWRMTGEYDYRAFLRVDLSAIPEGTEIGSASLNLRVYSIGATIEPRVIDLWQMSPFDENVTAYTSDGATPWPDEHGVFDGIDGRFSLPADRVLASHDADPNMVGSYMTFSSDKLTQYIQAQSDLAAGERYAYFQMSWTDAACEAWCNFYSTEADAADRPYLEISLGGSTGFPGDANNDGMVDVGDLGILAGNYGMTSGATWELGDFNNDGAVDVGDLGILAGNYGQSAAASVPEPASLGLLGMGILALLRRKR